MPRKKTDEAKKPEQVETTVVNPEVATPEETPEMPVAEVTPELPHDMPSPKDMVDLNAELAKESPTEPGLTGYLRARIKAGK